jgi:hypothetical protein
VASTPRPRVVAEVTLGEQLEATPRGVRLRARHAGRDDLEALVIAPGLRRSDAFRAALLDQGFGAIVTGLAAPRLVPTVAILAQGEDLLVVSAEPAGAVRLSQALGGAVERGPLPAAVVATIARELLAALAAVHDRNLVHGAVSLGALSIDDDGALALADLALGAPLLAAIRAGLAPELWRDLRPGLAPELVDGLATSASADVYAAGALVARLLANSVDPSRLRTTPGVERVLFRATDRDPTRRFASARAFADALLEAFDDDRWSLASTAEVAVAVRGGGALPDGALDDATEDLLATLGELAHNHPTRPSVDLRAAAAAARQADRGGGGLDELLAEMDAEVEPAPAPAAPVVDEPSAGVRLDAADLIEASAPVRKVTATPVPARASSPTPTPTAGRVMAAPTGRPSTPVPVVDIELGAPPRRRSAPVDLGALAPAAQERRPSGSMRAPAAALTGASAPARAEALVATTLVPVDPGAVPDVRGRGVRFALLALSLIGVGVAIFVIVRQQDGRAAAEADRLAKERAAAAETARLTAELPDPGTIRIRSNPDQASVWMLIGPTPAETFKVPTGGLVQLRVEAPGFIPQDVPLLASAWTGTGHDQRATVSVALTPGASELPADPGKPPEVAGQVFTPGHGVISVTSSTPGATVWMLVGTTNTMQLAGIEAGRAYSFRVQKDGYAPMMVELPAEAWRDGGDPAVPLASATKLAALERAVELVPLATGSGSGSAKRRRGR